MTHQTDRLEAAVYNALRDFQQTADWPQLRLAQMRHHLAEHIARDLTLTPGALPATPDGISARDLAHALDNSTPYPVELTSTVAGFMAERLLEMLTISKRDEHPVWQPEEQPEPGPHPQPEDPATLTEADPAAVSAAVAPPTDRAAVLREAISAVRDGDLGPRDGTSRDYEDGWWNSRAAAEQRIRSLADTSTQPVTVVSHRLPMSEQLAEEMNEGSSLIQQWAARAVAEPAAEAQQDETCTNCNGSGLDPRHNGEFDCPDCPAAGARQDGAES